LYTSYRRPIRFEPNDIVLAEFRNSEIAFESIASVMNEEEKELQKRSIDDIGSNNWVVSGELTQDGWPMMINDPHRSQAIPSLRYWSHLVGPGWNVIGGGEPEIPGISIGHNEFGAWGLTVFNTDGEDLYVYETNPLNSNQYRYNGYWEEMRVISETINVKGSEPVELELKYTRHGPVSFEDAENNLAYAVRPAWMEIGGAPYLASLRMDQAQTWEEFREASNYSNIPGENMIWADREGNIGWQAVGIAPIRRNFSGMVPVPGDGRYEWDGYLPIKAKPNEYNPARGFIETSNSNYTPPNYPYLDAIGFTWTDPFRWARGSEVLGSGRKFNMTDMIELQHDYLSIPARTLMPFFKNLEAEDLQVEQARQMLLNWDFVLNKDSIEAGIYVAFERQLLDNIEALKVPEIAQSYLSVGMKTTIDMLLAPDGDFGVDPIQGRDEFLIHTLSQGIATLREKLGPNIENWVYGQEDYKHALIRHPLSPALNEELQQRLNVGPLPRGGNGFTLGNTGSGDNQTSGASFRIFIDTRDWDNTLGMNTPGQVGDPDSPLYENLFELWANDKVFPAFYSRNKIESVLYEKLELSPSN
jgi:penicillin amidase